MRIKRLEAVMIGCAGGIIVLLSTIAFKVS
jgi:hypothetical protein